MKYVILFSLFAFSTATMASIKKTDSGFVEWTVKVNRKKEGVLKYSRSRVQVDGSATSSREEFQMSFRITTGSGVGGMSETPMTFEHNDERSVESVEAKIKEFIAKDIANLPVSAEEGELKITDTVCVESGFLKKKLECRALFEHVQVLNLK